MPFFWAHPIPKRIEFFLMLFPSVIKFSKMSYMGSVDTLFYSVCYEFLEFLPHRIGSLLRANPLKQSVVINLFAYLGSLKVEVSEEFSPILAFGAFCLLSPVQGEETAALGAGLGERFAVGGKGAFRVVAAAIEDALLFT